MIKDPNAKGRLQFRSAGQYWDSAFGSDFDKWMERWLQGTLECDYRWAEDGYEPVYLPRCEW